MTDNPALSHPALAPVVRRGVGDLCDRPRLVSPAVAETVVARAAWEAYQIGRRDAIAELMTTEDVAALLGVTRSRVAALARALGVGWAIDGRTRLFRPQDVDALWQRPPRGRPKAAG